jgi:hypothetical protein
MKKLRTSALLLLGFTLSASLLLRCTRTSLTTTGTTAPAAGSTTTSTLAAQITSFVHPAILNTQASLDLVGSQVNGGDPTRSASYQKVLDWINDPNHPIPTSFYSTVVVGSNGATSPSKSQIRKDAELAYALALRWTKTGNQTYANQAIGILNGWSYTFQNYALLDASTNPNQPDLEASWTTPSFVAAAEILRYYKVNGVTGSGWSSADINQFNNYLNNVKNNYINNTPVYNNNWNASAGYAKMAIGIFLNSTTVYQNGYNMIMQYLPVIINQSNGTIPEYCDRQDCVHFQYSLTAFSYAAELARLQGDNSIWTALGNRLSAGYDYQWSAFNGGVTCSSCSCQPCSLSSNVYPGVEVAYNYYRSANLLNLRQLQDPLGVPLDNTFLGFTTYTHFNVAGL